MKSNLYKELKNKTENYYLLQSGEKKLIASVIDIKKNSSERKNLAEILYNLRHNKYHYYSINKGAQIKTLGDLILFLEDPNIKSTKDVFLYVGRAYLDCYGTSKNNSNSFFFRIFEEQLIRRVKASFYSNNK
ncbi:hypothetical protein LPB90_18110 [Chryseobacterium sp. LC2016-29]|uniref:hypothetical protein n=1 Tax=Chryseobacterium sp. LC2016-29 TaxID=2897331 RepID=UPI001E5E4472|nr:hypothetical protein [Chryseobacterium sp. LC2016-29]MCD0480356.1 hypothetical protein [Chryseobacterium sp. LC2016-29]